VGVGVLPAQLAPEATVGDPWAALKLKVSHVVVTEEGVDAPLQLSWP
jgi:hypothetical protein